MIELLRFGVQVACEILRRSRGVGGHLAELGGLPLQRLSFGRGGLGCGADGLACIKRNDLVGFALPDASPSSAIALTARAICEFGSLRAI